MTVSKVPKVSEKSLELNIGAEILETVRRRWGLPKSYLRGLTQREERQQGADFFLNLDSTTRIFAFQFKAPQGKKESEPYRFKIVDYQHEALLDLAENVVPGSVFYVFPFYLGADKLAQDAPDLSQDTWLLDVQGMDMDDVFRPPGSSRLKSRVLSCTAGAATINPTFRMNLSFPARMTHPDSHGMTQGPRQCWL